MKATIAALMTVLLLCSCSSKRRWDDRNAVLEFEMAYGNPGAVEVIREQVQLYHDGLLMYRCERKIEMRQLSMQENDQLLALVHESRALAALRDESKRPLKELPHVHFTINNTEGVEHLWVYLEGMPTPIANYMDHLEAFLSKQFPGSYRPVREYAENN